ncbi:MAG: TonB-dependent receptor, partial [Phaeodactylibacter sp.]|nr:TonB-dependent receptor [Phaeodactylibacter sp.]
SNLSIKASYARMYQYIHLVSNSGISLPTDVWYPSTELVKPQISDQIAAGYAGFSLLLGKGIFLTNEYFYKWLDNQVDFVDWAELFGNDQLEQEMAIGKGRAYGVELSIEKKEGRLTGWIGYTLSKIERGEFQPVDPDAIFGEGLAYFSPRYDRRHDISVVAVYELTSRLTATASFVFGSGDLYWLPTGRFTFQDTYGGQVQTVVPDYESRNNVRLPAYHRLDLGLVWKFNPRWGESDLTFNVINAYDRRNAFFLYLEPVFSETQDENGTIFQLPERIAAKQVSLFPIIPSFTYNFKF